MQEQSEYQESHTPQDQASSRVVDATNLPLAAPSYAVNWNLVIQAGIVATLLLTLVLYFVPPLLGMPALNIPLLLGAMLTSQPGASPLWLGMAWHFGNGILFTLMYAVFLRIWQKQSSRRAGLGFGFILWFIGPLLLLPFLVNTFFSGQTAPLPTLELFGVNNGIGAVPALVQLAAHLLFGFTVGALYRHQGQEADNVQEVMDRRIIRQEESRQDR